MAAIAYQATLTALDAALATSSGADRTLGQSIRDKIAVLGSDLTTRFTAEVDTAKAAWQTAMTTAFNQAEEAAGYVYNVAAQPAPPNISFEVYSITNIVERLKAAFALTTDAFLQRALTTHLSAVASLFGTDPGAGAAYTSVPKYQSVSVASLERSIYALQQEATQWIALVAF